MKKLIIAALACTSIFTGSAALVPSACPNCGGTVEASDCEVVVFKVKGSGKAVTVKDGYKSISTMKITKGALALVGDFCADTGTCCYDSGMFFATVKVNKRTVLVAQEIAPTVWSVFGKNLDKIRTLNVKKGKAYELDSALFVESTDDAIVDGGDVENMWFAASAFGKVKVGISKGTKTSSSSCAPVVTCEACTPTYTPKTYSGYFVGKYSCVGEEDCFLCDCADTDVFGGTWTAIYMSSAKTLGAAERIAGVSYSDDDE